MNVFSIALKDLQIILRDRGSLFLLFLMPLVFIVGFTGIFSGLDEDEQLSLAVVNMNANGELAQTLIQNLGTLGDLNVEIYSQTEGQQKLDDGEILRLLTIPADFDAKIQAGEPATLQLVHDPDASQDQTEGIKTIINGVASELSLETQLLEAFRQMDQMMAMAPAEQQVFAEPVVEEQARGQFERSKTEPLVTVSQVNPVNLVGEGEDVGIQASVPGFMVLFVFLTAQATAQSIYDEKKVGSFRRLLAAPIGRMELLVGKIVPNFIVTSLQILVIFLVCVLLLPVLGMDGLKLGNDIVALILVSLLVALCSTSFGVLIAAFARTEAQVSGFSQVILWVMGALGGAFMPRFLMGDLLNTIGQIIPHSWATEAYYDLLLRGKDLAAIGPEMGALAGFTVVFFVIGLVKFDFD